MSKKQRNSYKKGRSSRSTTKSSQSAATVALTESSLGAPVPDSPGLVVVDFCYLIVPMFLILRVMRDVWPVPVGFSAHLAWAAAYITFCMPLVCMGLIRWWADRKWPGEGQETMLAFGLGLLALLRPWWDGVTFPKNNTFFVWGIVLLFMMWATRLILLGGALRFRKALAILGAFMGVVVLTGLDTMRFDTTYRGVLLWTSYALLFLLASNALRSKRSIGIVMAMFVAGAFAECFHSLIHLNFFLPRMRKAINEQPQLLALFFRAKALTPELKSRLESNRAFGSFLFANALAAYLTVIIPYMIGSAAAAWRGLFTPGAPDTSPSAEDPGARRRTAILTAFSVWLGTCVAVFGYYYHFSVGVYDLPRGGVLENVFVWIRVVGVGRWLFYVGLLPLLAGLAPGFLVKRYGAERTILITRAFVLPVVTALALFTLWTTYSRGGTIALILAGTLVALLFVVSHLRNRRAEKGSKHGTAAVVLFVVLAAGMLWHNQGTASTGQVERPEPQAAQTAQLRESPQKPIVPHTGAPRKEDRAKKPRKKGRKTPLLDVEGADLTVGQLSDPTSLRMRMSYWRVGLLMAQDNLWTGVGLGNFGAAYPKYQYLGASDVKQAHNDPIQLLAETGLFGLLGFGAFWTYLLLWGAWRIVREPDTGERWLLAGLYAGVVAFLAHSFVDFNFFNPSLAMFEFLLAGLFLARTSICERPETGSPIQRIVATVLLFAAALTAAGSTVLYSSERLLQNQVKRDLYLRVGHFFLKGVDPQAFNPKRPPAETAGAIAELIPDRDVLESFGTLQVRNPQAGNAWRKVTPDEPLPPQAVLVVTKPALAQTRAREGIKRWMDQVEHADAIFPYDADVALYLFQWYYMLAETARDDHERKEYVLACQTWAERGVERSPEQFPYRQCLARALWFRGSVETGPRRYGYFRQGLEEYKRTALLYPIDPRLWRDYADALKGFGKPLMQIDKTQGQALLDEAEKLEERIQDLEKQRAALTQPKRRKKK